MTNSGSFPVVLDEGARLRALRECGLLNRDANAVLDDLVALASQICEAPIALITLLDEREQWFKSRIGITSAGTSRQVAFCNYTILGSEIFVVPDARLDPRFSENPLVNHEPHIRFYAGFPVRDAGGLALGSLCVIDREPRLLSEIQQDALKRLARSAEAEVERIRTADLLVKVNFKLVQELEERDLVEQMLRGMIQTQSDVSREQRGPEAILELLALRAQAMTRSAGAFLEMLDEDDQFYSVSAGAGRGSTARSVLSTPVCYQGRTRGVIEVFSPLPRVFTQRDSKALELLSGFLPFVLNQAKERETREILIEEKSSALLALHEREQLFEAFMNRSPALAYMKDEEGRILFINSATERLWKVTSAEWLGKSNFDLWSPETAQILQDNDNKVLREWTDVEAIESLPLPNGEIRHFHSLKFPFKGRQGKTLVGGMSLDVTESKRAEGLLRASLDEKDILLKEVHHRVKNNLQVISSLLSLQARSVEDGATRSLLLHNQSRVFAMALVHEELYRSEDLGRVAMSEYLVKLFRYQASVHDAQKRIEVSFESCEEIYLPADQAIPCGLIVNELISNSFKHAFPQRSGRMVVTLSKRPGNMEVRVWDDGAGLPLGFSIESTKSLGLKVVQILTKQLNGTITMPQGEGCCFALCIPI